jgi:uncharacterized protein YebE (UPF0316 family)
MDLFSSISDNLVPWVLIPLFIFCARIIDVSISTIRIIFLGKGFRKLASILGFIESFVWITAVSQIMKNLNNTYYYFAWGFGFAAGTYIGMLFESKLSLGQVVVRIITKHDANELTEYLFSKKFSITSVDARGVLEENVKVLFLVIQRQQIAEVIEIIKTYNPNAIYTVEDVRLVNEAISKSGAPNFSSFVKQFRRTSTVRK